MKNILVICLLLLVQSVAAQEQPKYVFKQEKGLITSVTFSPNNRWFSASVSDGTIKIWDASTGNLIRDLRGHDTEVNKIAFSNDSQLLASASYDKQLFIRNASSGKILWKTKLSSWSLALAFAGDGSLAVACQDGTISVFDVKTGKQLRIFKTENGINALAFSPDGKYLITGGPIIVWDYRTGEKVRSLQSPGGITDLVVTHDGKSIISGHFRLGVRAWELESGKLSGTLDNKLTRRVLSVSGVEPAELDLPLASLAMSPDGKYLVSGDAYRTIYVWDFAGRKIIKKLEGHESGINTLAFSSDGKLLASGSLDGSVRVWSF